MQNNNNNNNETTLKKLSRTMRESITSLYNNAYMIEPQDANIKPMKEDVKRGQLLDTICLFCNQHQEAI